MCKLNGAIPIFFGFFWVFFVNCGLCALWKFIQLSPVISLKKEVQDRTHSHCSPAVDVHVLRATHVVCMSA